MTTRATLGARALAIGALCLLGPAPLAAQEAARLVSRGETAGADPFLLKTLAGRAERAGFDQAEIGRLLLPAVTLAERGLPSEIVLQKGLEGLSKGVPADRLAVVLSSMQRSVERAGAAAGPWLARPDVRRLFSTSADGRSIPPLASRTIMEGVAQAYIHDVPEPAIRGLLRRIPDDLERTHLPPGDFAAALHALVDLPLARTAPDLTADLLIRALDAEFDAADLGQLPAAMRAAERRGMLPAEVVARGVLDQIGLGTPAATVLGNLFQGKFPGGPPGGLPPGLTRPRGRPDGG
ncbi:MAG TPA: hypothetical protein VM737_05605 [Gemmatimonadota bacterium]|nr:hypothetical protein [Gemmatimonadota bacterium]